MKCNELHCDSFIFRLNVFYVALVSIKYRGGVRGCGMWHSGRLKGAYIYMYVGTYVVRHIKTNKIGWNFIWMRNMTTKWPKQQTSIIYHSL